jgi:hypothetical protein
MVGVLSGIKFTSCYLFQLVLVLVEIVLQNIKKDCHLVYPLECHLANLDLFLGGLKIPLDE